MKTSVIAPHRGLLSLSPVAPENWGRWGQNRARPRCPRITSGPWGRRTQQQSWMSPLSPLSPQIWTVRPEVTVSVMDR